MYKNLHTHYSSEVRGVYLKKCSTLEYFFFIFYFEPLNFFPNEFIRREISKKLKEICQIQENISSCINVLFLKSDTAAQLSRMAEDNVKNFPL